MGFPHTDVSLSCHGITIHETANSVTKTLESASQPKLLEAHLLFCFCSHATVL